MEKNEKRKVIIFSTAYLPMIGGAEVAIKEITDRLGDNFDFKLITARIKKGLLKEEKMGSLEIFRVGFGFSFDKYLLPFLGVLKALKINRGTEGKKSIIWAIMASFGGFGALFLKLLKPKWPFLLTLQEGDPEEHILKKVGFFYPIWKMIFKKADRVQVISRYLEEFARKQGVKCPVEIVPNGVDFNKFQKTDLEELGLKLKEKLGIEKEEKVVLTVSRLTKKNGVDVLIEAINKLKLKSYKIHKIKLLIAGEGEERKELERLVKKLNLEREVVFAGEIKLEEIIGYYKIADVFCRPSRTEGFGNVFIEAMAASLPVVATNIGGIKDFLRDGENGLFSEVDNPDDLAEKIKILLEDDKLRKKITEEGIKTAGKYDWKEISVEMKMILEKTEKRRKKILIATPIYWPEAGGPAKYARDIAGELKRKNFEAGVVTYGKIEENLGNKAEIKDDFKVIRVSRKWPKGIRHLIYFWKVFKNSFGVQAIYALDATAAGWPAKTAALFLRKRFFVRVGGDLLWERAAESGFFLGTMKDFYESGKYKEYKKIIYRVIKNVLKRAEKIIVPAESLAEVYSKYYEIRREKIEIIKNVFEKSKKELQEEEGEIELLFAGRMVKYKNLESLIEIAGDLEINFEIIGEGPERKNLEKKIKDLKLEDKIKIRRGMAKEELEKKIEKKIIGISMSWTEFNPNFILECLLKGKPVLLSRENELSVKLPEEFLADPFNREEIKRKIKEIRKRYDFYKKEAEKIDLEFSLKESAGKLINLIVLK